MEAIMKKRIRTIMSIIAVVLSLCFVFTACGKKPNSGSTGSESTSGSDSSGEKVTITFSCGETLTMDEWTTTRLSVSASDKSSVTMTPADPSMLYIRGSNVTALKAGSTTITATAGKKKDVTATLKVTINAKAENRPVLSITGDGELAVGQTLKYGASLSGVDASDYVVSYEIADTSIATVDAEGKVTALKAGKTKLIAKTTYRSVAFSAEKNIEVANEIKVIFKPGETEAKLAVSSIKPNVSEGYELEINGKKYVADDEGYVTLNLSDFDLTSGNSFEGKITEGASVYEFRLVVFTMDNPGAYQDGVALTPDENGAFAVDKTKAADANGLRWITFDDADTMLEMGYELLKVKVKFNKFCDMSAGIIDSTIAAYNYNFGYRYLEYTDDPATGEDVWFFWDNNYEGKGYGGAMKPAHHAPYGYGYIKILDAEGNLLLDYYKKQIEDGSGVHGNWSDYITPLVEGTEYILLFDISKTHDISLSGFDDALITGIEWCRKEETTVSFGETEISVDEWVETRVAAITNDGSLVTYTVSDPEVLYIEGSRIVGLKAGTAKVIATANGKTAELNVTVNENAANRPVVELGDVTVEEAATTNLSVKLKSGETEISADKYELTIAISDQTIANVSGNVVAGLKAGETEITATFTYCGKEFTATADVTVSKAEEPVDPSVGKLYQDGEELAPDDNGHFVVNPDKSNTNITFDPYAVKSGFGYTKIRFTVKFSEITNNNITFGAAGGFSFGYSYGNVYVGWYNNYAYNDGAKVGAYVGAFGGLPGDPSPTAKAYLRVYNAKGEKIFEHYDVQNWSSSGDGYGYIDPLAVDTEYIFEIDVEKTGDITLYGFDKATFTKVVWVKNEATTVTFDRESVEAEEWKEFDFSAITNDGSDITFSTDNEEVIRIEGKKAIGLKAGTANIIATANGVTAVLPVTITENAANRPLVECENAELTELETANLSVSLVSGGVAVDSAKYTVAFSTESDIISVSGNVLTALTAGRAVVTATVTYWGETFTTTITVIVNAAETPVDPSVGKLFQGGAEVAAGEDGTIVPDASAEDKALTFDPYLAKSALGMRRIRFTVKFKSIGAIDGTYEFGYTYKYGNNYVYVKFDNNYNGQMYAGAFLNGAGDPHYYGYVRIYDNTGAKYFEYYDFDGWSSSGWGYVHGLQVDTEYTFDVDIEKTGDITLYGFENAEFTKIEWVDYNKTEITFDKESVEVDEWTWFDFSATTNDLSALTFSSDDESIVYVKGNKAIGLKAGTTNIVAKNSAGKAVLLPVTIVENLAKQPVVTVNVNKTEIEVLESAQVDTTLKIGEEVVSAADYDVTATASSEAVTCEGKNIIGKAEGSAKVTVTVDYCGKIFTAEIDITVKAAADPSKGKLFQNGNELVADENGNYKVDTSVAGDANGLHWLTVDAAKTATYTYLRFNVTFDSFPSYKKMTAAQYDYNFGYNYTGCTAFWDNLYPGDGFGGALDAGGNAQNVLYYWNVYTASNNEKVLDLMGAKGWSKYYTLQTGVEYIFEFNVKAMGDSFTLAGFETATIKNIVWAEDLLG